jgi:PAS domain S-box-containing protein
MSFGLPSDLNPALAPILDTVLDAVIVMGENGRVMAWNSVAEHVFGWSAEEAVGQMLAALVVPPQYRKAHEDGLQRLNEGGEVRVLNRRIEITALCKDGREIPVELSITRASGAHQDSFIGFLRDISERRNAEDRQALLVNELSHRVKNILAAVQAVAHQTFRNA